MTDRIAKLLVLVEDANLRDVVTSYLKQLGHDTRNIRVEPLASGRGSGAQRVLENFARLVRQCRRATTRSALVVGTDADQLSVEKRRDRLETALRSAGEDARSPSDPIALVIPKRNVETWIFHFDGQPVDEQTDYSDKAMPARGARRAAEGLIELTHSSSLPKDCLDSVRQAIPELRRIRRG